MNPEQSTIAESRSLVARAQDLQRIVKQREQGREEEPRQVCRSKASGARESSKQGPERGRATETRFQHEN